MASMDLYHNITPVVSFSPAIKNATASGSQADLSGYESATVILQSGAYTDGTQTFSLQESDTTTDGDFTAVAAADLVGSFPTAISDNTKQNSVFWVGYVGQKRYIRVRLVAIAGVTGAIYGATIVKGNPRSAPTV